MYLNINQISSNNICNPFVSLYYHTVTYQVFSLMQLVYDDILLIYDACLNIPTHSVWSSLATSSPTVHLAHLSFISCMDPEGHAQNNGFEEVGTLSPGQMPEIDIRHK